MHASTAAFLCSAPFKGLDALCSPAAVNKVAGLIAAQTLMIVDTSADLVCRAASRAQVRKTSSSAPA
ncbi:hypothetical protein WJX75_005939 [Coccomyxa subellipsoidea]|uniref:Uncharacterized protein n=1 Tax=Coccomyxa subellipsoidea TaxID=248742 RepID=A0ABR2YHZ4_9CHLO